ncbi:hypothetical protein CEP80_10180 [Jonesia denitrificans]|nr:hypothetical protein CEP80_10180 [Jonesia denitrificans]
MASTLPVILEEPTLSNDQADTNTTHSKTKLFQKANTTLILHKIKRTLSVITKKKMELLCIN